MLKRQLGISGESFAVKLLEKENYILLERNYRTKIGEIDIIAIKDDTLIFVEVKTRRSVRFGKPEEAVNSRKIVKIARTGELYLKLHPGLPKKMRIDVVSLQIDQNRLVNSKIIKAI